MPGVGYALVAVAIWSSLAAVSGDALDEGCALAQAGPLVAQESAEDYFADALERYAGSYRFVSPRIELLGFLERTLLDIDIRVDEQDHLQIAVSGGEPVRLIPTGPAWNWCRSRPTPLNN